MDSHSAEKDLHLIRTLMERTALYRQALGPIMTVAGLMGVLGAIGGVAFQIDATRFIPYWVSIAVVGLGVAVLISRRQAKQGGEVFWSAPARRVVGALLPPFVLGGVAAIAALNNSVTATHGVPLTWAGLYGCALHAAGHFTVTGLRKFAWIFLLSALVPLAAGEINEGWALKLNPHLGMGVWFGALQLAYGLYLLATEKKAGA